MDANLAVLEACVGICTAMSIYMVVVLTWYYCKPRRSMEHVNLHHFQHYPEINGKRGSDLRNGQSVRCGVNGGLEHEHEAIREGNGHVGNGHSVHLQANSNVAVTTDHVAALHRLCLASAWLLLIRYVMEHLILLFALSESFAWASCEIMIKLHIVFYLVPISVQYIFLWLRQHVLYRNPILKQTGWACSRFISWIFIVIFFIDEVVSVGLLMSNERYERNSTGNGTMNGTMICMDVPTNVLPNVVPWIVAGPLTLICQSVLLLLFIQPLCCKAETIHVAETVARTNHESMFLRVRRVFVASSIIMITDLLALVGCMLIKSMLSTNLYITLVMLDYNLLANQLCLVATYDTWKSRLFPFCSASDQAQNGALIKLQNPSTSNGASSTRSHVSSTSTTLEEVFCE